MERKLCVLPAICLLLMPLLASAQQLKLGSNPAAINKAAVLELESAKQGLLLTRITDTTTAPLSTAPDGTLLFFKGDNSLRIRSNNAWRKTLTTIDTNNIANFSYKVRSLFAGAGLITYDKATGAFALAAGTVLTNTIKGTFSIEDNNSIITAVTPLTKTVPVTGAKTNASVIVNPRTVLPTGLGIAYAFVSAANAITINFTNTGGGLLGQQKLGSVTFDVTVINP